jgi:tryptophan-rich sensory protein
MASDSAAASLWVSSTSTSPTVIETDSSSRAAATRRSPREKNATRSLVTLRHASLRRRRAHYKLSVDRHGVPRWRSVESLHEVVFDSIKWAAGVESGMTAEAMESDKAVGTSMLFGVVAALGAAWMFLEGGDEMAGAGFALAMIAAGLSVVAVHLYWG